jgi:hypothetical protein
MANPERRTRRELFALATALATATIVTSCDNIQRRSADINTGIITIDPQQRNELDRNDKLRGFIGFGVILSEIILFAKEKQIFPSPNEKEKVS